MATVAMIASRPPMPMVFGLRIVVVVVVVVLVRVEYRRGISRQGIISGMGKPQLLCLQTGQSNERMETSIGSVGAIL